MSRADASKKYRNRPHGGIPAIDPVFGASRYSLPETSEKPGEKLFCTGSIPELGLSGCGYALNIYTSRKVREGKRLILVCLSCEAKWKELFPKKLEQIRRAIHYLKPKGMKPPGSGRKKKISEEAGEK